MSQVQGTIDTAGGVGFSWDKAINAQIANGVALGVVAIAVFGFGFLFWAATAPLTGAAVASGTIIAEDHNIRVQHLEGGIVATVLAREGDRVAAGAPLVRLDRSTAEATLARLETRILGLRAQEARLVAQRDGTAAISFGKELAERSDEPLVSELMEDQRNELKARRARDAATIGVFKERIAASEREIEGVRAERAANQERLAITEDEVAAISGLFDKGLANIDRLLTLRRAAAEQTGLIGTATARIASLERNITEVREQIEETRTKRLEETLTDLTDVRTQIGDLERQKSAAADAVARVVIRAPAAGTLVKLYATTLGAVIAPGGPVAEILPRDARLLVELRLPPRDIDVVAPGQNAELRLTALDRRTTPTAPATVTYVSADKLIDTNSDQAYYTVRLSIDKPLPAAIEPTDLYPGMQVEAYVKTGERTFMAYLTKPIVDSFARAFRED